MISNLDIAAMIGSVILVVITIISMVYWGYDSDRGED